MRRLPPALAAAAACALLSLPYLSSLGSFFASDDWILLYHQGRKPPLDLAAHFSPHVVWFYRPLQAIHLSVLYHAFGLDPLPYNLNLLALHLGVCALVYLLAAELTGRRWFAAGVAAVFAGLWFYVDVVTWKSNLNTLHSALATLGACLAFARYLRGGARGWLILTWVLSVVGFIAKEMAVNVPLLLVLVWALCREGSPAPRLRDGARVLAPVALAAGVYVLAHERWVENIYPSQPGYDFVNPIQAVIQSLFIYNHTLLAFYRDPVLLPQVPRLQAAVHALTAQFLLLPFLLLWASHRKRDPLLWFGTAWMLAAFLPAVFLTGFHSSRYYYLPAFGAALILVRLFEMAWGAASRSPRRGVAMAAVALFSAYFMAANAMTTLAVLNADLAESDGARRIYEVLRSERERVDDGAFIILRNAPPHYFYGGYGAPEMARFALDDSSADAAVEGTGSISTQGRAAYLLDAAAQPARLQRLGP